MNSSGSEFRGIIRELREENEELKGQNQSLRAANEAKHREIAAMDRRHVDQMYKLQCEIRNLEELIDA